MESVNHSLESRQVELINQIQEEHGHASASESHRYLLDRGEEAMEFREKNNMGDECAHELETKIEQKNERIHELKTKNEELEQEKEDLQRTWQGQVEARDETIGHLEGIIRTIRDLCNIYLRK